ncbi:uncharacterized protein HKW66_Vig0117130 [Vigna angularis]|uniref:Uncharacterized protein n=1 Tax=Phaseolus angularis TaxID=3914 RepID=A0A8T0JVC9_PHAAN|nr:uncharacterized protein HKW66_Vig0117130 [Vigna angularis]
MKGNFLVRRSRGKLGARREDDEDDVKLENAKGFAKQREARKRKMRKWKENEVVLAHSSFASLLHFLCCSISFYCCTALHCLCLDCFRVGALFAPLLSPLHWLPVAPPILNHHRYTVTGSPLLHDALLNDVALKRPRCTSVAASSVDIFLVQVSFL